MSLLHYNLSHRESGACVSAPSYPAELEERYKRNPAQDLKEGIDLVFELKGKLDKMHPIATETLVRLLSM